MRGACLGWLAAILLAGCSEAPQKRPELGALRLRPTRGYILITFDALRSDHLGAYGYERSTSPFFDFLAPDDIPLELLRGGQRHVPQPLAAAVAQPSAFKKALAALRRYAGVARVDDARCGSLMGFPCWCMTGWMQRSARCGPRQR